VSDGHEQDEAASIDRKNPAASRPAVETASSGDPGLAEGILQACRSLDIDLPPGCEKGLAAYAAALWDWNTRLNLTRHTDVARFVSRDVGDAMAILPHLAAGEHVLDFGTGGGVPGVILAILRADLRLELSESVGKRIKALRAILEAIPLALEVHAAAGQLVISQNLAGRFDSVVIRGVAPLVKLLGWLEPLSDRYGRLLLVKGPRWEEEKAEARHRGFCRRVTVRRIAAWPIRARSRSAGSDPVGAEQESVLLEVRARSRPPADRR
jgi:16S rRNA (guanine527-N7)-methyltransferase